MKEIKTDLAVLGGGPGGYSAAFRAADLGKKVVIIERDENLGGVCLNEGCIPSKTLLHAAYILDETKRFSSYGINFTSPQIDLEKIRAWKNSVIKRLALGIKSLANKRNVEIINGTGNFINQNQIEVLSKDNEKTLISFKNAVIATGSSPTALPFIPEDPRIMDSSEALNLPEIPREMLVIGGGAIGLEMATIYSSFGTLVTIVELTDQLAPGTDQEIIEPLKKYNEKKFHEILLATTVIKIEPKSDGLWVTFENSESSGLPRLQKTQAQSDKEKRFDHILVAAGRQPNTKNISLELAKINVDQKGFISVNKKMQTNIEHIFAVGDAAAPPMFAHKATFEGKLAAEVIAGLEPQYNVKNIPSVIYTDPEVATVGLSETEAKKQNISYAKKSFPWLANGRSISLGRREGITKLLFDPASKKILGGAIVGPNAGELISEIALAISLEATAEQISHVIHPHPTLSETIITASEIFLGTATDF